VVLIVLFDMVFIGVLNVVVVLVAGVPMLILVEVLFRVYVVV